MYETTDPIYYLIVYLFFTEVVIMAVGVLIHDFTRAVKIHKKKRRLGNVKKNNNKSIITFFIKQIKGGRINVARKN